MAPAETIAKFPIDEAAREVAVLLVRLTVLAPLLESVIAPVSKLAALVKVMALAPAVKLEVPGTVNAPVCVIAPTEVIAKFCPIVEAAREVARLLVKLTLLLPLFEKEIAPVKELVAVVKVMGLAPAVKLDVPDAVNSPV